jgi:F-type H+-transporting ATPase subunit delta
MSELATIARPYAEAVFKRASESGTSEKWSEMLAFLSALMSNKEFTVSIDNPKISKDKLTQLLLDIAEGQVNDEGKNFLKLLVENKRLLIIPAIADLYEKYKAESEGYVDVDLLTAYSLTKEEEKKLAATLERTFNKKIHMHTSVDKSLIGGIFVRAGDHVIDGSIKGQLQQLAKQL